MLEPREADIPALFLVLVVLPLVIYILLGQCNESAKKKARVSMLAQLAAEEACRVEAFATATVTPIVPSPKSGFHECARCFGPATTRCSRCKSVRYCSGRCQIIHWRQGHKQECQLLEYGNPNFSSNLSSCKVLLNENPNSMCFGNEIEEPMLESIPSDVSHDHPTTTSADASHTTFHASQSSTGKQKLLDKRASRKFNREILESEDSASWGSFEGIDRRRGTMPIIKPPNMSTHFSSNEPPPKFVSGRSVPRSSKPESSRNSTLSISDPLYSEKHGIDANKIEINSNSDKGNFLRDELSSTQGMLDAHSSPEKILVKGSKKPKTPPPTSEPAVSVSQRSAMKASREYPCSGVERNLHMANGTSKTSQMSSSAAIPAQDGSGISSTGDAKVAGLRKLTKIPRRDNTGVTSDSLKKNKVLFPYEEIVKFFQCEVWDLSPRGLLNCGNSCYANAVLQSLTCTKPLTVYLLRRSHSRKCRARDWCLMCELEQHVLILREGCGPLSLSRILSHMGNIGCRMGGGKQEDAHEFLRLLVTSMQSICLEELGGEKKVDSRLHETTFVQQIFGGCIRSKVQCLRCCNESERYENIMDLTLEILGWVESLEDALTQFTAPEDLDGENMYRCGRCATYVKARKQLSIHEAPNILTIVLKRFQTGKYGKINKCITFPDMLDMIPFMTGTGDMPPLYTLYAVVVHLDTLNASFSGHYVSYVKDLQGSWFRIDDTEVQPVSLSQVMSEGAYILFYSRSFPRPPRVHSGRASPLQAPSFAKRLIPKTQKLSRPEINMSFDNQTTDHILRTASRNILSTKETYAEPISMDYSDATSSDWSLFTSSDESSFTTESTRDSFSTIDYADAVNTELFSSLCSPIYIPEYSHGSSISCTMFSPGKPQTRFFSEKGGFVTDSSMLAPPYIRVDKAKNPGQFSASLTEFLAPANNCSVFVKCEGKPKDSFVQVSGCCEL